MGKTDLAALERALEAALSKLSTDRKRAFVREYLVDLNLTKSAERAGYSKKSARQEGSRLLSDAAIQEAIQLATQLRAERTQISSDDVLREIGRLAFSDLRKVFDDKGALLEPKDWPESIAGAIASVEVDELFEGFGQDRTHVGYTKKIRLWDKNSAIDKLGRHLKMWGGDQININLLQQLSDAELNAKIATYLKKPEASNPPPQPPKVHATPQPQPKSGTASPPRGAGPPKKA